MASKTEGYFPRGGVKPKKTEVIKEKHGNLFGLTTSKTNKKKTKDNNGNKETTGSQMLSSDADVLTFKKIVNDMLILGCIQRIRPTVIYVELPNLTCGLLSIKDVSKIFYDELNKRLEDDKDDITNLDQIFKVGQYLPVKVLNIKEGNRGTEVQLSTDPVQINSNISKEHQQNGMFVWGTVKEKSDHCYIVDIGVKNCSVTLPFTNVDENVEYEIGQPFYSVVKKCETSLLHVILTVSALKSDIDKNVQSYKLGLDSTIPGMQVNFTVSTILPHGLEGKILDGCVGYINELYLSKPLDPLKNYKEEQTLKARILYTQPTTKFTYLSLQSLDDVADPVLKIAEKMKAQIFRVAPSGVYLKLGETERGFVSNKRLLKSTKSMDSDLKSLLRQKYGVGSSHLCLILNYSRHDKLYICTFEKELINGGFQSIDNIIVGQKIKGIVTTTNVGGVCVKVANLDGFVPNMHLSDVQFSNKIKSKFTEGQNVTGRVWSIDRNTIRLGITLKHELLEAEMLTSYDTAIKGKQYSGVVVKAMAGGFLILFCGDVKGWLPNKNIPELLGSNDSNVFYIGQVIKCFISKIFKNEKKLELSMNRKNIDPDNLDIGTHIEQGKIVKSTENGFILITKKNTEVFLSYEQTASSGLAKAVKNTYKKGDVIHDLICIGIYKLPIVSKLEHNVMLQKNLIIPSDYNVTKSMLLRSSYNSCTPKGIFVVPLIAHRKQRQLIPCASGEELKLAPYQSVLAKVVSGKMRNLNLSINLADVFDYDYMYSIDLLSMYLNDVDKIREHHLARKSPVGQIQLGQIVRCDVETFNENKGCTVKMAKSNIKAVVESHQYFGDGEMKKMTGVVLWVNYAHNIPMLSLSEDVVTRVTNRVENIDEDLINTTCYGSILLIEKEFAIAILKNQAANGHFVYLPIKLHENDLFPNYEYYCNLVNKRIKIVLCKNHNGKLLGMEKTYKKILEEKHRTNKSRIEQTDDGFVFYKTIPIKRKHSESEKENKTKKSKQEQQKENFKSKNIEMKVSKKCVEETSSSDEEMEVKPDSDVENMNCDDQESAANTDSNGEDEDNAPLLPGVNDFFQSSEKDGENKMSESSEDEDGDKQLEQKKKKRLSNKERAELAKAEDERLRKIENELADSTNLPQSAEQFERVLLGKPDDSEMWLRYISYYAQATEFEKARSVIKRALERISYSETQERLNVWLAYLNLENMYGTKDSFEKVFEEASRCNDSLTIYLESIKMLSEMQKYGEMEEKIRKVRGKFKQELRMWLEVGRVYYQCKKFVDARKLKDIALVTILDKKIHVNLLVQFGILEFNHGEAEQAEALFETILQSDPKRVDVWSTYVDQLIKINKIDLARNVLKRAAGQKLPYKKMRTLFKKYHSFEKNYGDKESLEHVKNLLKEFTLNE